MPGLRERNKARTRAEIRRQALRLFRDQGYAATTVEQIAAAAEVSQSTFFRYFPSKEDVVLRDDLDPLVYEAFVAAPAELTPIQAFRSAIRTVYLGLSPEQRAEEWARHRLTQSVPELRARNLDSLLQAMGLFTEAVARRVGRQPDDLAVRAFVGALVGVGLAVLLNADQDPSGYLELFDEGLAQLEAGLPL
ncbi:acyl-CoA-like ligand-binding transcription factor [Plantactinospora sonchi]|uniref:TetR family transcriptional regulator n=1 Tax=Plantactinospora sonchi TaxID=1544735 RepID=A0ABU7S0P7_9ACTN